MRTRRKVGIKYCGGCNPSYERVEMIQQVQSLLKDRFTFSIHDQQDLDIMVLVSGCPRACANKNSNHPEVPSRSIVGESDFKSLIDWLVALDEKGDI
jgi:sulfite reductase beta subunit-like hemoprotein